MKQTTNNKKGEASKMINGPGIGYGTQAQINKQWADAAADREEALERIRAKKANINPNPHVELSECDCPQNIYCPNCW